jgi:hypothetical protein
MLKLEYRRKRDKHQTVTLLGSPKGIADLYWQLTHNYSDIPDGTGICDIKITNLDGADVTNGIMQKHYEYSTQLDKFLD